MSCCRAIKRTEREGGRVTSLRVEFVILDNDKRACFGREKMTSEEDSRGQFVKSFVLLCAANRGRSARLFSHELNRHRKPEFPGNLRFRLSPAV